MALVFPLFLQSAVLSVLSRCLHLQEYQSKTLMKEHEIEVQHFEVVDSVEDAKLVPARLRKLISQCSS